MTARDRTTLKSYFDAGDVPGAPQYADLIDSFALISEAVGDMMKSVYDTDNDGKVESADHANVADDAENANFASLAASATDSDKIDGVHLSGLFKDTHVAIFGITADGTNFQTYPFITGSYTIGPYTTNMPLPSTWWAVTIVRRTADSLMAEAYCVGDKIKITGTFTHDGIAGDPEVIRAIYKNPSDQITTIIYPDERITKEATGVYSFEILASVSGNWHYRVDDGLDNVAEEGQFQVRLSKLI